jgi:hypothetical protein
MSTNAERNISLLHLHRNRFDPAENHCQRAIFQARLYEAKEEMKTDLLCQALRVYSSLRETKGYYDDAVAFAEEAYDCAAIAYNPVHPEVQEAAGTLIHCLTKKGDLNNAELYAQVTLDNLKDPAYKMDQRSELVAKGYCNFAQVIDQQEQLQMEETASVCFYSHIQPQLVSKMAI